MKFVDDDDDDDNGLKNSKNQCKNLSVYNTV